MNEMERIEADQPLDEAVVEEDVADALEEPATPEGEQYDATDYDELIERDLSELRSEFPELSGLKDITSLNNPMRYAALRDLGLSPAEAYMATRKRAPRKDSRSHLVSAVARVAASPSSGMSRRELETARGLFAGMSDAEIQSLYKRVIR